VVVDADVAAMTSVWLGDVPFAEALRSGGMRLTGARRLTSAFRTWLMLSHFAGVARPLGGKCVSFVNFEASATTNYRAGEP